MKKLIITLSIFAAFTAQGQDYWNKLQNPAIQSYEIKTKNKYGIEEKTGEVEISYNGNVNLYKTNTFGVLQIYGYYELQPDGTFIYSEYNKYGIPERVGTLHPLKLLLLQP